MPTFLLTGCQFSCSVGGTTTTTTAEATTTTTAETTTTTAPPTTLTTVAVNTTATSGSSSTTQGQTTTTKQPSTATTTKVPTITGLSPTSGLAEGGTSVVITGKNFTGVSAVMFGTVHTMYHVDSQTQITATSPAHDPGTVEVVVTTAAGSSSTAGTANDYTYFGATIETNLLMWKLYEETDPHLVWTGDWLTNQADVLSGGAFRYTNAVGAAVTVTFTGTRIALIAVTGGDESYANVYVDGYYSSVNFYSAAPTYKQVVWESPVLANGVHQVKIECAGQQFTD